MVNLCGGYCAYFCVCVALVISGCILLWFMIEFGAGTL